MKSRFLLLMVTLLAAATSFANINLQKYSMYLTAGTATAGKTIDVTLSMKNANAITSWQTKLALPEGFTLAAATASGTRYGETLPTVTTQANEDGTITLFCEVDEPMTGTDGVVATLTLAVAADVAAGDVGKVGGFQHFHGTGEAFLLLDAVTHHHGLFNVVVPYGVGGCRRSGQHE